MAVPRREIERIPIELRRSGSVVEHALKLKAESTEVAEGVALLRMMSLSHPDAIFEVKGSDDYKTKKKKKKKVPIESVNRVFFLCYYPGKNSD